MRTKPLALFVIIFCITASCEKINKKSPVPDMPVSLELYLLRDAPELDIIGNYKLYTKPTEIFQYIGFGGILIYHNFNDEIVAFDLCCPNEINPEIRVDSIVAGEAICRTCHAKFDIGYGSGLPRNEVTKEILRKYRTALSGNVLRVYRN